MRKIIVFLVLFFFIGVNAECNKDELARLKNNAKNIEIYFTYEIKEKKEGNSVLYKYGEYTLNATNVNDDTRVLVYEDYYSNKYKVFKKSNGISTLTPFYDGEKVTVTIEAYVNNECSGEKLATKIVKLPYYNEFSQNNLCGNDNVFYNSACCNEIVESKFSDYEKFKKCLDNYYKEEYLSTVDFNEHIEEDVKSPIPLKLIIIVIAIIILILGIIIIISRKIKKSRI